MKVRSANLRIVQIYDILLTALAYIAATVILAMAALIVYDVLSRNLGLPTPPATVGLSEWGLLYTTMLAAPWITRERGHICIELLTATLPARANALVTALVRVVCVFACGVLAWYSLKVAIGDFQRGELILAGFDADRWVLVAVMPIGFALMAVEFARSLVRRDHKEETADHQSSAQL